MAIGARAVQHDFDETPPSREDLLVEVKDVVLYPDVWLDTPNDQLGGRPPRDFLDGGDDEREFLHDLLQSARFGVPT